MWNCIHSRYFCRLAWFTLNGHVNRHSTKYWFSENGLVVHEVPLHDLKCWSLVCSECTLKVGVWCVVSAVKICAFGRHEFFLQFLVSSDIILIKRRRKMYSYFMQGIALAHTANLL